MGVLKLPADHCRTAADVLASARRSADFRRTSWRPRIAVAPPAAPAIAVPTQDPLQPLLDRVAQLEQRVAALENPPEPPPEPVAAPVLRGSVPAIVAATAEYFHLTYADMICPRRTHPLPFARQVAMYLARTLTIASTPRIGTVLRRDHTTVLHGCRRTAELLALNDEDTTAAVDAIRTFIATGVKDFPAQAPLARPNRWRTDVQILLSMLDDGKGIAEISKALVRTEESVLSKIERLKKAGEL